MPNILYIDNKKVIKVNKKVLFFVIYMWYN